MLKKISISLIILFTAIIVFIAPKVEAADDYAEFRATAAALGFSVSNNYYPYRMLNDTFNVQERTYTIKDKLQYYTRVDDVLLKNKDANIYALIYRVLVSPLTHEIQFYDACANSIDTLEIYGNYGIV